MRNDAPDRPSRSDRPALRALWAQPLSLALPLALLLALALLIAAGPASSNAQSSGQSGTQDGTLAAAKPAASLDDLTRSVVGVTAETFPDARTAASLGTHRAGTGVVIDSKGTILTIGYLILEAQRVRVTRHDGREFPARVVGYDAESGLGLVQVPEGLGLEPMQLGSAAALGVQDPVLMITRRGSERANAATVVSRRTFTGYWEYLLENAIYTAPPQGDYAGAALVDQDLQLVGIGSLYVENAAAESMSLPGNLFVPVDRLQPILRDLIESGRPQGRARPWLGVNVGEQYGRVIVTRITPGGPASDAGLHPGDIILELAGRPVDGVEHFYRQLWALGEAGVTIKLKLVQRNAVVALSVPTRDRYAHYRTARTQ